MTALNSPIPVKHWPWQADATFAPSLSSAVVDATGEFIDHIGQVYWEDGGTHTVSSSGGAILWRTGGTVTFADAGTTIRISIQDLDATNGPPARGDGTDDVYAELVGGTDTISASTTYETAMESGSKSLAHCDFIAVRFTAVSRGGSDAVSVAHMDVATEGFMPYVILSTASPSLQANVAPNVVILADDGTHGWLAGAGFADSYTARVYDSGTGTADEYATLVQFPIEMDIIGIQFAGRGVGNTGDSEFILYTDPLGTPSAQKTATFDAQWINTTANGGRGIHTIMFSSAYTLPANTLCALSIRPTGTGADMEVFEANLGSNAGAAKPWAAFGGVWSKGTRLDNTGAFTQSTDDRMFIWPLIDGITVSTGGGGSVALPGVRK